jgi:hypothetical protein
MFVDSGKEVTIMPYPKVPLLNELRFTARDPYIDVDERIKAGGPEKLVHPLSSVEDLQLSFNSIFCF